MGDRKRSSMRELLVLRSLLKREEQKAEPFKLAPRTLTPIADSALRPAKVAPNYDSQRCASTPSRKRRRKPVRVEPLFLEPEPEPLVHARALLQLIQNACPEKAGGYVPQSHLERPYHQMCAQNDWAPCSWRPLAGSLLASQFGVGSSVTVGNLSHTRSHGRAAKYGPNDGPTRRTAERPN